MNEADRVKVVRAITSAPHIYAVLGIHWQGDHKEARRRRMMFVHPDHYPPGGTVASAVNRAHDIMDDDKAHQKYRLITFAKKGQCPACKGKGCITRQKGFSKKEETVCLACAGSGYVP